MSPSFWKKWLKTTLGRTGSSRTKPSKIAVVGVGNELNGDDAAGVEIALRLQEEGRRDPFPGSVLILNGATAPENFTGVLRRFAPEVVLLVDAADMGEKAGAVRGLDWRDSSGFGPSTHMQPIATLAEYLETECGCRVALLGIQPESLAFDARLSTVVHAAVGRIVDCLVPILRGR